MKNFATAVLLAIGASATINPFNAGELHSKETFKYGRFVTSMKSSNAKGTGSFFYLYDLHDKIDNSIFEEWNAFCVIPSHFDGVLTKMSNEMDQPWNVHSDFKIDYEKYHTYTIEWTPDYMSYKIDDIEIRRLDNELISGLQEEQNLVMSLATFADQESIGKDLDKNDAPFEARLKYVEVYDYDLNTNDFKLRFKDQFDYIDEQRWARGDGKTWQGLNSTFTPNNAYTAGGELVLKVEVNPEYDEQFNDSDNSDQDSDEESNQDSDENSEEEDSDEESEEDSNENSEEEDSDQNSEEESEENSGNDSSHESNEEGDFHVIPPPKSGTLDSAIESSTRVLVTMVRTQLESFSHSMSQHLQPN